MRRRELLTLLIGAAAWPNAARAQSNGRIPVIGFLGPAAVKTGPFTVFQSGLSELGYVEGKNVEIKFRFWVVDGQEDEMEALARELVDLKVDVIVTSGDEDLCRAQSDENRPDRRRRDGRHRSGRSR